jgi:hypothetical protein
MLAARLTRRQKLMRGVGGLLALVVIGFLLLGGPANTLALLSSLRQPQLALAALPPTLHLSQPRFLSLPPGMTSPSSLRVSPASGDLYACWTQPDPATRPGGIPSSTLHLAVLHGSTSDWTAVRPPLARVDSCLLVPDTASPASVLLSVYGTAPKAADASTVCALPTLYYSADAGHSWAQAVWPSTHVAACSVRLALVDGRIYVYADTPLLPPALLPAGARGRLITSADVGATWHAADDGLPETDSFALVGLRPGGHLLAETFDNSGVSSATLWESETAGADWRSLGLLPGAYPQVYASSDAAEVSNGGWGRLYVSALTPATGAVDGRSGGTPLVATGWPDTRWSTLPPPPATGLGDTYVGQVEVAAVGPASALLLLRVAPVSGKNDLAPPLDIWLWNPAHTGWRRATFPLPGGSVAQGESWSGGTLHLWFVRFGSGALPSLDILALDVPPSGTV